MTERWKQLLSVTNASVFVDCRDQVLIFGLLCESCAIVAGQRVEMPFKSLVTRCVTLVPLIVTIAASGFALPGSSLRHS